VTKNYGKHQSTKVGLDAVGIHNVRGAYWNLTPPELYEEALNRGEGHLAANGPLVVRTDPYTGRSPNDKFTVDEPENSDNIWWGDINRPIKQEQFNGLHRRVIAYLQGKDVFVQDAFAGADPRYRLPVRIITELASNSLFVDNMFVSATPEEKEAHIPEFTVIGVPNMHGLGEVDGLNSEAFVLVDFSQKLVLIGGTSYAGEIKKSIFTVMNYLLTDQDVLPMHCSANYGTDGDTALFFGLSGTGKTTLSADATRTLIGDDEHGWSKDGVFNFEGGCYAKVINLSPYAEPEIYATTKMFGTILENVIIEPESMLPDFEDGSITLNTRASYPIRFIPNAAEDGMGKGHPRNVIFLTADAFGVMPPISRLTPAEAMYHFISGYTAKVAGTERGITEPQATFSACFGAPFMPRHPGVYAEMLGEKIEKYEVDVWLVNTGWTGGTYGVGHRMPIKATRGMLRSALSGKLKEGGFTKDPIFGVYVPHACGCPDVDDEILIPRNTWADKDAYDKQARKLAQMFVENFKQFEDGVTEEIKAAAPKA